VVQSKLRPHDDGDLDQKLNVTYSKKCQDRFEFEFEFKSECKESACATRGIGFEGLSQYCRLERAYSVRLVVAVKYCYEYSTSYCYPTIRVTSRVNTTSQNRVTKSQTTGKRVGKEGMKRESGLIQATGSPERTRGQAALKTHQLSLSKSATSRWPRADLRCGPSRNDGWRGCGGGSDIRTRHARRSGEGALSFLRRVYSVGHDVAREVDCVS
jgi:hypothetical protein